MIIAIGILPMSKALAGLAVKMALDSDRATISKIIEQAAPGETISFGFRGKSLENSKESPRFTVHFKSKESGLRLVASLSGEVNAARLMQILCNPADGIQQEDSRSTCKTANGLTESASSIDLAWASANHPSTLDRNAPLIEKVAPDIDELISLHNAAKGNLLPAQSANPSSKSSAK